MKQLKLIFKFFLVLSLSITFSCKKDEDVSSSSSGAKVKEEPFDIELNDNLLTDNILRLSVVAVGALNSYRVTLCVKGSMDCSFDKKTMDNNFIVPVPKKGNYEVTLYPCNKERCVDKESLNPKPIILEFNVKKDMSNDGLVALNEISDIDNSMSDAAKKIKLILNKLSDKVKTKTAKKAFSYLLSLEDYELIGVIKNFDVIKSSVADKIADYHSGESKSKNSIGLSELSLSEDKDSSDKDSSNSVANAAWQTRQAIAATVGTGGALVFLYGMLHLIYGHKVNKWRAQKLFNKEAFWRKKADKMQAPLNQTRVEVAELEVDVNRAGVAAGQTKASAEVVESAIKNQQELLQKSTKELTEIQADQAKVEAALKEDLKQNSSYKASYEKLNQEFSELTATSEGSQTKVSELREKMQKQKEKLQANNRSLGQANIQLELKKIENETLKAQKLVDINSIAVIKQRNRLMHGILNQQDLADMKIKISASEVELKRYMLQDRSRFRTVRAVTQRKTIVATDAQNAKGTIAKLSDQIGLRRAPKTTPDALKTINEMKARIQVLQMDEAEIDFFLEKYHKSKEGMSIQAKAASRKAKELIRKKYGIQGNLFGNKASKEIIAEIGEIREQQKIEAEAKVRAENAEYDAAETKARTEVEQLDKLRVDLERSLAENKILVDQASNEWLAKQQAGDLEIRGLIAEQEVRSSKIQEIQSQIRIIESEQAKAQQNNTDLNSRLEQLTTKAKALEQHRSALQDSLEAANRGQGAKASEVAKLQRKGQALHYEGKRQKSWSSFFREGMHGLKSMGVGVGFMAVATFLGGFGASGNSSGLAGDDPGDLFDELDSILYSMQALQIEKVRKTYNTFTKKLHQQ